MGPLEYAENSKNSFILTFGSLVEHYDEYREFEEKSGGRLTDLSRKVEELSENAQEAIVFNYGVTEVLDGYNAIAVEMDEINRLSGFELFPNEARESLKQIITQPDTPIESMDTKEKLDYADFLATNLDRTKTEHEYWISLIDKTLSKPAAEITENDLDKVKGYVQKANTLEKKNSLYFKETEKVRDSVKARRFFQSRNDTALRKQLDSIFSDHSSSLNTPEVERVLEKARYSAELGVQSNNLKLIKEKAAEVTREAGKKNAGKNTEYFKDSFKFIRTLVNKINEYADAYAEKFNEKLNDSKSYHDFDKTISSIADGWSRMASIKDEAKTVFGKVRKDVVEKKKEIEPELVDRQTDELKADLEESVGSIRKDLDDIYKSISGLTPENSSSFYVTAVRINETIKSMEPVLTSGSDSLPFSDMSDASITQIQQSVSDLKKEFSVMQEFGDHFMDENPEFFSYRVLAGQEVLVDEEKLQTNAQELVSYMNKAGIKATIDDIPLSVSAPSYDEPLKESTKDERTKTQTHEDQSI